MSSLSAAANGAHAMTWCGLLSLLATLAVCLSIGKVAAGVDNLTFICQDCVPIGFRSLAGATLLDLHSHLARPQRVSLLQLDTIGGSNASSEVTSSAYGLPITDLELLQALQQIPSEVEQPKWHSHRLLPATQPPFLLSANNLHKEQTADSQVLEALAGGSSFAAEDSSASLQKFQLLEQDAELRQQDMTLRAELAAALEAAAAMKKKLAVLSLGRRESPGSGHTFLVVTIVLVSFLVVVGVMWAFDVFVLRRGTSYPLDLLDTQSATNGRRCCCGCCSWLMIMFLCTVMVVTVVGGHVLWNTGILQPILSELLLYSYVVVVLAGFVSVLVFEVKQTFETMRASMFGELKSLKQALWWK